ncbi:hypothetical protein KXR64_16835 [Brucella intermedia]|uniref:hypothetical protein n=1 Tax=Brucella TaxID=234 RepID=UPI0009467421|nr:hypothetical protein [Brucella intermedia]
MLTREQFDALEPGDVIETESLFPSLTKEKVSFHVTERTSDKVQFVLSFLGITLGKWSCVNFKGKLVWEK